MKLRILTLLALSLVSLRGAEPNTLASEEKAAGWILLFDGETLDGWRIYGQRKPPHAGWKAEEGMLRRAGPMPGGNIITEEKFEDFEFSWEWRISKKGNNGVKYLVTEERKSAPGPEYQLLDNEGHPDGRNGPKRITASLCDILPPAEDAPHREPGDWNQSRIIVKGERVEHWLNGSRVLAYELGSPELQAAIAGSKFQKEKGFGEKISGHLMLTDHVDACDFRNSKLRKLEP